MTPEQREELKQAAMKVGKASYSDPMSVREDFNRKSSPAAILSLIAQVEALEAKFVIGERPSDEQQWAKVGPAVAFHLIDRHADNWSDAGDMMVAWADARQAAKVEALTVPQDAIREAQANAVLGFAEAMVEVGIADSRIRMMAATTAARIRIPSTIPAIPGTKEGA